MVYSGEPEDGACLVFHRSAQKARILGWPVVESWAPGITFVDCRARWLIQSPHLMELAEGGAPQVIESPPTCPACEMWGGVIGERSCSICEEHA